MRKQDRQNAILDLIGVSRVGRQDELVRLLGARGYSVTQASVSRDLDELGVVKVNGAYAQRDVRKGSFDLGLYSVMAAGSNMIVVRCASGMASASAVKIDSARLAGVAGTIAGDDTIFIAIADERDREKVMREVSALFEA